jgi:hypothetical protein
MADQSSAASLALSPSSSFVMLEEADLLAAQDLHALFDSYVSQDILHKNLGMTEGKRGLYRLESTEKLSVDIKTGEITPNISGQKARNFYKLTAKLGVTNDTAGPSTCIAVERTVLTLFARLFADAHHQPWKGAAVPQEEERVTLRERATQILKEGGDIDVLSEHYKTASGMSYHDQLQKIRVFYEKLFFSPQESESKIAQKIYNTIVKGEDESPLPLADLSATTPTPPSDDDDELVASRSLNALFVEDTSSSMEAAPTTSKATTPTPPSDDDVPTEGASSKTLLTDATILKSTQSLLSLSRTLREGRVSVGGARLIPANGLTASLRRDYFKLSDHYKTHPPVTPWERKLQVQGKTP